MSARMLSPSRSPLRAVGSFSNRSQKLAVKGSIRQKKPESLIGENLDAQSNETEAERFNTFQQISPTMQRFWQVIHLLLRRILWHYCILSQNVAQRSDNFSPRSKRISMLLPRPHEFRTSASIANNREYRSHYSSIYVDYQRQPGTYKPPRTGIESIANIKIRFGIRRAKPGRAESLSRYECEISSFFPVFLSSHALKSFPLGAGRH